ncbi:RNA polymerase sigma factor RpoH [Psychrobacter sp. FDAARGOS_221]|nr:RNA polymerase sigma factor RpoH [Psychrobacter sp. FDAARGOS_221]
MANSKKNELKTKKKAAPSKDTAVAKKAEPIDVDVADLPFAEADEIVEEDILPAKDVSKPAEPVTTIDADQAEVVPENWVSDYPNTSTRDLVPAMPVNLSAPGINLGAYMNSVHQIPILTPEQEQELAHRYYDDGDVEAARILVMSHLRFVIHIARSYSGYGLPQADLIQEGNLGLMKAVKRFDPNKGVRLVSFAVHWIKAEIHEFVIRNWRIVKVATTKAHRKLFFNLRSLKKTNNQLTLEEADAIAADLNVTRKQVLEMESRLTSYDASFEAQSSDDEDGHYAPQLFLEDGVDPAEMVEDADWEENNTNALMDAMDTLDERSRDIVEQRWLSEQKSTLHELAAVYNISAERVRQIEKNAMDKIREAMTIDSVIMPNEDSF